MGATRDEAIARLGEPKSQIVVGNRQVLYFAHERVVLRAGRVIEVEELAVDVAPESTPAPQPSENENAAEAKVVPLTSASSVGVPPESATTSAGQTEDSIEDKSPSATVKVEPGVVIKSVRPPSKKTPQAASVSRVSPAVVAPSAAVAAPRVSVSAPSPSSLSSAGATGKGVDMAPSSTPSAVAGVPAPTATTANAVATNEAEAALKEPAPTAVPPRPATRKVVTPVVEEDLPDLAAQAFTPQTYVIGLFTIGGGIGYLVWRARQRRLELEATAVSHPPFAPTAASSSTLRFSHELLGQLEWKRFEELVVAYYNKTGVVAVRTKTGPMSPVQIKIAWKGEQRPFACVRCIAHPHGLIDVKPLQDLFASLEAEDTRRGYVVTTGKFSVPARDLAEEKHLTLIPGDLLLEKLNALPEPAKAELMKVATTGDYSTATCPMCDIAMSRTAEGRWSCVQCGTVLPG